MSSVFSDASPRPKTRWLFLRLGSHGQSLLSQCERLRGATVTHCWRQGFPLTLPREQLLTYSLRPHTMLFSSKLGSPRSPTELLSEHSKFQGWLGNTDLRLRGGGGETQIWPLTRPPWPPGWSWVSYLLYLLSFPSLSCPGSYKGSASVIPPVILTWPTILGHDKIHKK